MLDEQQQSWHDAVPEQSQTLTDGIPAIAPPRPERGDTAPGPARGSARCSHALHDARYGIASLSRYEQEQRDDEPGNLGVRETR